MLIKKASYRIAESIVRLGFLLFTSATVHGRENVPRNGPLIVVSNHLQMADIPLLGIALPRKLVFVGKVELWRNLFFRTLGNWYECFPVDRTTTDFKAMRRSLEVLERGGALVIFPEGKRSPQACLLPGNPGAALLALRSSAVVLPVGITGTERAGGMSWLWRHPRMTVTIGRPFNVSRNDGEPLKTQLASATKTIMRNIAALLPPPYCGDYGEKGPSPDA
ncbi:MAG: 1-acyl-sn-glycerol-3-phosphate acyltransferase [Chloroflexi bacterium]|nr:1-acyl-sn-glycerol-3-phosphate acyltransferase [Chloroflexota bacterium]